MLKRTFAFLTLVGALLAFSPMSDAEAAIVAKVDLARQRMDVYVDGALKHSWPVSTGRKGWETRPGTYYPFALTRRFYSSKWKMNLPYLVSIGQDGTAIHGTDYAGKLGRPASHGCIRLSMGNAARFYSLVQQHGMYATQVVVTRAYARSRRLANN
ncbi:MAG: L,D-transpeptidase [Hyphomicrobiaceae bacterium]